MTRSLRSLYELEVLRVVGMGLILYEHAKPYLGWDPRVPWLTPNLGGVGLTIFFLLSGFLLKRSQLLRQAPFNPLAFLKSRLVRILPLYWLALVAFTGVFHFGQIFRPSDFSPLWYTLPAHAWGFQLFLAPYVPVIFTIWYMGALIPYYVSFALTARLRIGLYLAVNGLVLLGLYGLKLSLARKGIVVIDTKLLLHFPTFLFGAYYATVDADCALIRRYRRVLCLVFMVLMLLFAGWQGNGGLLLNPLRVVVSNFSYYFYCVFGAVAFTSLSFWLCDAIKEKLGAIAFLSASSYAVYLFHRPLYGVFYDVALSLRDYSVAERTLLYPLATAFVIVVSYAISRLDAHWFKPMFAKLLR